MSSTNHTGSPDPFLMDRDMPNMFHPNNNHDEHKGDEPNFLESVVDEFSDNEGDDGLVNNDGNNDLQYDSKQHDEDVTTWIPDEYLFNPHNMPEPMLHFLLKYKNQESVSLPTLIKAANDDLNLHRARIQAGLARDVTLLRQFESQQTTQQQERSVRKQERTLAQQELQQHSKEILDSLESDLYQQGMTQKERTQIRLARWQRVLELFVYCPDEEQAQEVDLLGLLDKLLQGCSEEEEMSQVLEQASQMCSSLCDLTALAVKDAKEDAAEAEDAYQIRLEAHSIFARNAALQSEDIQLQFRNNGRAALQIGQQLEYAEAKRKQCESASILIRRWWMMENLAEQEANSGEELHVHEEVRGVVPVTQCRMDPLFTRPDQSLEAAKALRQLRAVVKSRANAATAATAIAGFSAADPDSSRRFDLVANLIARTSTALESRLINTFSQVYSSGGVYDFSDNARSGSIDWIQLRELAQALLLFDSGRNLHKRYVEMVISSRFPELFQPKNNDEDDEDALLDDKGEFNSDATRSLLSSLFHRVGDVCKAEFELIAHVFGANPEGRGDGASGTVVSAAVGTEDMPLQVARALLQRVISDPRNGLQARINDLLESIDRRGDYDAGNKKLDTFVVIHEKAAGLFQLLRDASEKMVLDSRRGSILANVQGVEEGGAKLNAAQTLVQFLNKQEIALSTNQRRGYLNLELRLLHHECCNLLGQLGYTLLKPARNAWEKQYRSQIASGVQEQYVAPIMPLCRQSLKKKGFIDVLSGPLKQSVLRQPLIFATDSLARARLMFGEEGGEDMARVVVSIYNQMCSFYGDGYMYPLIESLGDMLDTTLPSTNPQLPFDENEPPHDLGVDPAFWISIERIHSAIKAFDRELWAENRKGSGRVWEILANTGAMRTIEDAKDRRVQFFGDLESRGLASILRALDTISTHIQWILVMGGESMLATGGNRILHHITGQSGGPYAIPSGSSLDAPNSPAVKSLCFCLRGQFVHVQAALTPESLSAFWTALSMRLYDILVARLLQHYYVSTVGAVILGRDVDALRGVALLAGREHSHWDNLRELVTLYMTPPDALRSMLVGKDGDVNSGKGLFATVGRDECVVFMSRRVDYRYKTAQGQKKSGWAVDLLSELGVHDPTDRPLNIGLFAAERKA